MKFELFINFNGNCREAVEFYAQTFNSEVKDLISFGQAPADPNYPIKDSEKDLVMYAEVKIGDKNIMFMDMSSDYPLTVGNNISPTINTEQKDEINRLFDALKEGGKVYMAPQKTFFSAWYAMVEDKFGIIWQLLIPISRA
ncbi:MAG: VOC family protein [Candidatus Nomurabacteria bacterium]|jgi:PhnB protein|nr:VOC family protein [Candidatus Nomurabacteria bacterium]